MFATLPKATRGGFISLLAAIASVMTVCLLWIWGQAAGSPSANAALSRSPDSVTSQPGTPVNRSGHPKKILYFEGEPRAEAKFITRATAADASLQVVVLQRTTDGKYIRMNVDGPDDLRDGFPTTREKLFAFQGLILGSIEATAFTPEQHSMIADFVATRGGGLLALGGERSFGEGGWSDTPLADVLPIVIESNADRRLERAAFTLVARPTDGGTKHPATHIARDDNDAARMWRELPPVTIVNRVYARPTANILLTGTDGMGREQVVLAAQSYGLGRALVFTPEDSWVWVMKPKRLTPAHERFWRGLLEWLVEGVAE